MVRFRKGGGVKYFKGPRSALEYGQTRIQWLQRALHLRCEADHSPSVEVKNGWSYTFTPPYACVLCTGTTLPDPFCFRGEESAQCFCVNITNYAYFFTEKFASVTLKQTYDVPNLLPFV